MFKEPEKRISEQALKVWRIAGVLNSIITFVIAVVAIALTIIFDWSFWISIGAISVLVVYVYFVVFLFPSLRWKRWRYEVRDQEIELQHGIFIIKRTLVPMVRVQHVDTVQGPILRKYDLATVTISTAATIHEIPALEMAEAEEMRFFISKLARVADEDV